MDASIESSHIYSLVQRKALDLFNDSTLHFRDHYWNFDLVFVYSAGNISILVHGGIILCAYIGFIISLYPYIIPFQIPSGRPLRQLAR